MSMNLLDGFRWRADRAQAEADNFIPAETEGVTSSPVGLPAESKLPRIALPWVALVFGIPLSMFLAYLASDSVENAAQLRFERLSSEAKAAIEDRVHFYINCLYGLKAHFASLDDVSRLQFHEFVESLDIPHRYPGFDLLNYATYVPLKDKAEFERLVRTDKSLDPNGYPDFAINPPGTRPEYYVISYLEPMDRFRFAFGLDIAANPEVPDPALLLRTLRAQRDTGRVYTSGLPLRLLSRKTGVGLAMRLAVYRHGMPADAVDERRAAYIGSVGAGIDVGNLMADVLPPALAPVMRFRLLDSHSAGGAPANPSARKLLFDSESLEGVGQVEKPVVTDAGLFTRSIPFEVGGRIWDLDFSAPKAQLTEPLERQLPLIVLLVGSLISVLVFGVLYSLASSRHRALAMANDMTRDLQDSNRQLQILSRQLVDVQEAERRHFSRELHDQIGQNLTALSINIDILKSELPEDGGADRVKRLDQLADLVESTNTAIENVMADLRPPMLDDYGLLPALQWYGEEFSKRSGIEVEVEGDESMRRLAPGTEIAMFRIAQEALNNIAKHARASAVTIGLHAADGHCELSVADNGVGVAAARAGSQRRRPGMGMLSMRERTQAIDGRFEFETAPGGGSRVVVTAPYPHAD
jgi:signal transduction histidine kinase